MLIVSRTEKPLWSEACLQHIEFAGVHSGDAAMVLPPHDLEAAMIDEVRQASHALAKALKVIGLMNIQFAIKEGELFLIEVNPSCLPYRALCQQSDWGSASQTRCPGNGWSKA